MSDDLTSASGDVPVLSEAEDTALLDQLVQRSRKLNEMIAEGCPAELELKLARRIFCGPGEFEAVFGDLPDLGEG